MAKSKQDKISINSAPKKEIVYRTTSVLIPYARNSRTHSPQQTQQIASSIKEFGFTNPVLIDEENGIIAGHGRVLAAQLLGMDEVPCIVLSGMTGAKKRAYVIADNKLALNAGWDDEMLRLEFEDLKAMDFDLDLTGFSQEEIDNLMPNILECDMPSLPDGDKPKFRQITFTLHNDQADQVDAALDIAKEMGPFIDSLNENSNGNALARVCETFLTQNGG